MGRWFPGIRKASPEQAQKFREAQKNLFLNSRNERAAGVRDETPRYHELNREANRTAEPLSGPQRFWHFQRALIDADRAAARQQRETRQQRASERQDRQMRRTR